MSLFELLGTIQKYNHILHAMAINRFNESSFLSKDLFLKNTVAKEVLSKKIITQTADNFFTSNKGIATVSSNTYNELYECVEVLNNLQWLTLGKQIIETLNTEDYKKQLRLQLANIAVSNVLVVIKGSISEDRIVSEITFATQLGKPVYFFDENKLVGTSSYWSNHKVLTSIYQSVDNFMNMYSK